MWRWRRFFRRIESFIRRDLAERELTREVSSHLTLLEDEFQRRGMTPDEARLAARRAFGGVERAKELQREERSFQWLDQTRLDVRYALRTLTKNLGFTFVAVLTLAVGIGATTAMFSVVNGILIQPLPYPKQDRLIEFVHEAPGRGLGTLLASPAIYFTYRDHNKTFESVGHWNPTGGEATVIGRGEPETVRSLPMTHELLKILGADPILGRSFTQADDLPGSVPTVIISYSYWRRRFGGSYVLGETLIVDGVPRRVIGVLPQWFRFFAYPAEIFYPLQHVRSAAGFPSFSGRAIARLKEGVTLQEANADVARMIPILYEEFGRWDEDARFGPRLRFLKDSVVGNLDDTLWMLMGMIAILLLIACANVANLVLVRAHARRQELAIRAALGAGWSRIARVVFMESAVLGLAGGIAGLGIAYLSLPLLLSVTTANLPQIMTVSIDSTAALFTLGVSLLAALMFTLIPMINLDGSKFPGALHVGGRSMTEGREGNRTRHFLVVSQVALALTLLTGSGLMLRTFQALRQVDPGFRDPDKVQTLQLNISSSDVPDLEKAVRMQGSILDRLAAVPGVESAGLVAFNDGLPLDRDNRSHSLHIEGRPADATFAPLEVQVISPKYFETLGTPLLAGRTFDWTDIYDRRPVVLVSENMARSKWGSAGAALGKRVGPRASGPWLEVVGVVANVHHDGLTQPAPAFAAYPLLAQVFGNSPGLRIASFVVRCERAGTAGFLQELQKAIWSVNNNLSLRSVRTLGDLYQSSMALTSMTLLLLVITGVIALVLGLIGIYGVVSYAVLQRRREIGIRMALGARHGELRWMFVRHALVLAGIGVVIGLTAAIGLTRLMTSQLFGVTPLDPLTYAAVALILVAATALASFLPAWRASVVDPVAVLKVE
jgi:putative ABC transport system permease protein